MKPFSIPRRISLMPIAALAIVCAVTISACVPAAYASPVPLVPHFFASQSYVPTSSLYYPYRVAVDSSGDVYITNTNDNTVLKETLSQGNYTETVVGSGLSGPWGVAVDSSQNVYVVDQGNARVLKETFSAGAYTQSVVATSALNFPTGIAVDSGGNLYICDSGHNRLLKETPSGNSYTETVIVTDFGYVVGVTVDSSGDVFATDVDSQAVYEETYSAGSYTQSTVSTTGLNYPYDISIDGNGNLYIADFANDRIVELTNLDGSYSQGNFPTANMSGPLGLASDAQGDIYIADTFGFRVLEVALNSGGNFRSANVFSTAGPVYEIFNFSGGTESDTLTLGAINIESQGRQGLDYTDADVSTCSTSNSYSAGDTCFVSVNFSPYAPGVRYGAVQLLDGSSNVLASTYVSGTGEGPMVGFSPPAQIPVVTGVSEPFGLAFDAYGNLFEADYLTGNVKEFYYESGYTESNTIFQVDEVAGMAVDGAGNIFFSAYSNSTVYEALAASGYTTINTVSSTFTRPFGIAVDGSGNLFVADRNNAVFEVPFSGSLYGSPVAIGSGFNDPFGIALDGSGNVYVADQGNNAVKEILQAGGYSTVNTLATVAGIRSMSVDANGNVYLAITGANTVSEILAVNGVIPNNPTINTLATDSNAPQIVTLDPFGNVYYGTGSGATIVKLDYSDAPALAFASTTVGLLSSDSPQSVTVENLGNQPLIFPAPGSGTNPGLSPNFGFGISSTCPIITPSGSQGTLAANTTCVYAVNFSPTTTGSLSGSVTLTDNALYQTNVTQSIELGGTGTAAAAPAVSLAPTTLAFGNQSVGAASATHSVTLTNTGTANLSITAVSITGANSADFAPTNNCGATIAPSAQCTVNVTFTPSLTAAESATLQFTDNAAGSPQSVALSGTGTVLVAAGYSVVATPAALTIVQGQSASTTLTVTPVGGMIGTLAFSCTGLPANANCVFFPTLVVMAGDDAAASVMLTVNTTGTSGVLAQAQPPVSRKPPGGSMFFGAFFAATALCILPAGLVLFAIPERTSKKRRHYVQFALLLLIGISIAVGTTACGNSSSPSKATPVGQYSVSAVAAVGGANGQSAVVTITITQ